MRNAETMN